MTDDLTFYQHGDEPDAASFAAAAAVVGGLPTSADRAGYVVHGFDLDPDLDSLELDISSGTALILRRDYPTSSPNVDPTRTYAWSAHPVQKEDVTQLALEDDTVNHVFIDANISTRDTPLSHVNQSGEYPSDESIKIGEIDTSEDTPEQATSEQWHLITTDGTLTYPDQDAAAEAASGLPDGTAVYDRDAGVYHRVDGDGVTDYIGRDEIAEDAVGSDELEEDTVTVAGNEVALGSSTDVAYGDLEEREHGNEDHTEDFETEAGAQQRVDDHEAETSGVHGVESGEIASTDDVSPIQASSDVDHNETQGGTSGTPHDHADPDDPVTQFDPGDVADGEVLTNENGSLTGTEIDVDAETEIDLIEVATTDDLPDPDELDDPTIAYVDEEDDYLGVFQE